ncbi:hypothetical protein [Roseibium sp. MMSF_3544]|uniref:hypothetical protein n=1 Tax=unclassified Roseibium TaxID=2629323 RepID=UPI00273F0EA4|nr:hypothetical protein [Roseibium sp. MMSF_3544]
MASRVAKYAAMLAVAGAFIFIFIVFSQANIQDLREKYQYREPTNLSPQLGRFYVVKDSGALRGPVCSVPPDTIENIFDTETKDIQLTNTFGSNIPLIAEWTKGLFLAASDEFVSNLAKFKKDSVSFDGHTITLRQVSIEKAKSISDFRAMNELLLELPRCEETLNSLHREGRCVVSIFEIVRLETEVLGIKFHDDEYCHIRRAKAGEPTPELRTIPENGTSFVALISQLKITTGLIDSNLDRTALLQARMRHAAKR